MEDKRIAVIVASHLNGWWWRSVSAADGTIYRVLNPNNIATGDLIVLRAVEPTDFDGVFNRPVTNLWEIVEEK